MTTFKGSHLLLLSKTSRFCIIILEYLKASTSSSSVLVHCDVRVLMYAPSSHLSVWPAVVPVCQFLMINAYWALKEYYYCHFLRVCMAMLSSILYWSFWAKVAMIWMSDFTAYSRFPKAYWNRCDSSWYPFIPGRGASPCVVQGSNLVGTLVWWRSAGNGKVPEVPVLLLERTSMSLSEPRSQVDQFLVTQEFCHSWGKMPEVLQNVWESNSSLAIWMVKQIGTWTISRVTFTMYSSQH